MLARVVNFLPQAIEDIENARDWYSVRNEGAARAFLSEIDQAVTAIRDHPDAWPQFDHGTRRFLLRRFPFSVVYRVAASDLHVVAVAHARRRPGFWTNR